MVSTQQTKWPQVEIFATAADCTCKKTKQKNIALAAQSLDSGDTIELPSVTAAAQ